MDATTRVVLIAAAAAAVGAVVQVYVQNKIQGQGEPNVEQNPPGSQIASPGATLYTSAGQNSSLQPDFEPAVYAGPGSQGSRSNFNGAIWTKRFGKGGNPNAGGNGGRENSWAFQTATKNPFANGNNCTYARAVTTATQDPTNQATSLVLGAGYAPNNPAA